MQELSLNILDIAQNSIKAGATLVRIEIEIDRAKNGMRIAVIDNGCGMDEATLERVVDPFYTTRTTRSVGLGVPLFKMEAEMTGGSFVIDSEKGTGTTLTASFKPSSVDMIPLGDISGTVQLLISCNPDRDFLFTRQRRGEDGTQRDFALDTRELRQVLGDDVPLDSPDVVLWIKEFLEEQTGELLKPSC